MYRDIMEFRSDTPDEELAFIKELCLEAHEFDGVKIEMVEDPENKNKWYFGGDFRVLSFLNAAWLKISKSKTVKKYIKTWYWEDEDPEESGDLIETLNAPFYHKGGRVTRWEPENR